METEKLPTLRELGYQMALVWFTLSSMNSWDKAIAYIDDLLAEAEHDEYITNYYGADVEGHAQWIVTITSSVIGEVVHALEVEKNVVRDYAEITNNDPKALSLYYQARITDHEFFRMAKANPIPWLDDSSDGPSRLERLLIRLKDEGYLSFRWISSAKAHFSNSGSRRPPLERIQWLRSIEYIVAFFDACGEAGYVGREFYVNDIEAHFERSDGSRFKGQSIHSVATRCRGARDIFASKAYNEVKTRITSILDSITLNKV
jgi:hypothetical protein